MLLLVLFVLILAMGSGALACRWLTAEKANARHMVMDDVQDADQRVTG